MNDQASALRQMLKNIKSQRARRPGEGARVVCVTSGKGGVGKTSFTVNLAIALSKKGLRSLVIDADFGLANVDVLMGISPIYNLSHVLSRQKSVSEIICEGPGGVRVISGGSGVSELMNLSEIQLENMVDNLLSLEDMADVIFFDTGAGVNPNILRMISSSDEAIVVTTPEPTSVMDAYAIIKSMSREARPPKIRLVVNKAESAAEGADSLAKFAGVVRLYLDIELEPLGYIPSDPAMAKAVRLQQPLMFSFPKSPAARSFEDITLRFAELEPEAGNKKGLRGFLYGLLGRD